MDMTLRIGGPRDSTLCWQLYRRAVREGAAEHYTEDQRRAWAPDGPEPPWIAERLTTGRVWIAEAVDPLGAPAVAPLGDPSGDLSGDQLGDPSKDPLGDPPEDPVGASLGAPADKALGFLVAAGFEAEGPVLLDLFFVRPDMRRAGVAAALYDAFVAAARGCGQDGHLTAYASLLLRPFLERRGWVVLEEEWAERSGVKLNRFRMEKRA